MSDSVTTLRPASVLSSSNWAAVPSGTLAAVTSDNSLLTYMLANGAGSQATLLLGAFTLPALAILHGVQARMEASDAAIDQLPLVLFFAGEAAGHTDTFSATSSTVTFSGAVLSRTPGGQALTEDLISTVEMVVGAPGGSAAHVHELYLDVLYNQAPAVTVASVGPATTMQPTVTVDYSDPENDRMERYRVVAFAAAQADPGNPTAPAVFDTGETVLDLASGGSFTVAVPARLLANRRTYHFYAIAADAGSGTRWGAWSAGVAFTPTADPLAAPAVALPYPDAVAAAVDDLWVVDRHNLLTENQGNAETDTTGWTAGGNTNIASSGAHALRGAASLSLTAVADGDVSASTFSNRPGVHSGAYYTAMAAFFPVSNLRDVTVALRFFDGGGSLVGEAVAAGTEVSGAFVRVWVSARAPVTAVSADVLVMAAGAVAGEAHHVDTVLLAQATFNAFEDAAFGELATLWVLEQAGTSTAAILDGPGRYGPACAQLEKNDANSPDVVPSYWLGCRAGERWIVSVDLWSEWLFAGAAQATLRFVWQDLSELRFTVSDLPLGAWERRSFVVDVPVGKTAAFIAVAAGAFGDAASRAGLRVDGLQLQRVDAGFVNGGFETSVGPGTTGRADHTDGIGWAVDNLPAIAPVMDAAVFHSGAQSLRLGAAAGVVPQSAWHAASQDFYVAGAESVTVDYWWRLQNVRQSHVKLQFLDGSGQLIQPRAVLSPLPPGAVDNDDPTTSIYLPVGTDSAGDTGWLQRSFADIPVLPGAVWARLQALCGWSYDGTNPGHTWVDDVAVAVSGPVASAPFMPGGWSAGGAHGLSVVLERSADGGATWTAVRWPQAGLYRLLAAGAPVAADLWRANTVDHEAARGGAGVVYRAVALGTDGDGNGAASDPWETAPVVLPADTDCLKDPLDPTLNIADLCLTTGVTGLPSTSSERQVVGEPFGRSEYVVPPSTVRGEVFALPLAFETDAAWAAFRAIRGELRAPPLGRVLLLQLRFGDGTAGTAEQYYVRLGPDRSVVRLTSPDMAEAQKRLVTVGARQVRPPG